MKHAGDSGFFKIALRTVLSLVCALIFYPSLPVNYFTISHRDQVMLATPLPNAYPFRTAYVHSLQLTPVIDDYRFVNGRIWGWEEWTQSHNAGLPSVLLPHSRLIMSSPWMIYRGGRNATDVIHYKVGDAKFGRNLWRMDPWDTINIFKIYPKFSMAFRVSTVPLKNAPVEGFRTIHGKPDMSRIFSM